MQLWIHHALGQKVNDPFAEVAMLSQSDWHTNASNEHVHRRYADRVDPEVLSK